MLTVIPFIVVSQQKNSPVKDGEKPLKTDSATLKKDTTSQKKISKGDKLDAQIDYNASDSIVFYGDGTGYLHGKSDIKYKKIDLKADYIRLKLDSSMIFAKGRPDSVGRMAGTPEFSEGESKYESKELTYNLKSKKGYIKQAVTQQGEGYIVSETTKKVNDDILCLRKGKYTTCDDHDHPDFYLELSRAKMKNGEYVVSGPAHLVVADVPLPIVIPFGYFPFTNKYSSGVVMPSYDDDSNRGFGLTGGGYYFAINDYVDLELTGDIYTMGSWSFYAKSTYTKKYKYNGNFSFDYMKVATGDKDLNTYSATKNMRINWSHSQNSKANPYLTLSASVNFSTSGYNKSNVNTNYSMGLSSENTKSSSVSFTKRFARISPLSITGNVDVTQSTRDSVISMTLPNLSISLATIYPFRSKNSSGDKWYEKISIKYSGTFTNSITTKENKLLYSSFAKDWKNKFSHNIPVSASFNILKYINVSPSFNYSEKWFTQSYNKDWDAQKNKAVTDTLLGFKRVYSYNAGISASTKLYGFYTPIPAIFGTKIQKIRHVLTPSIGFSYAPDFGTEKYGYYGTYTDGEGDIVKYSKYGGDAPGSGKTGSITYSFANNLEMKVRNDNDSTGENPSKNISLIDNLSFSGSYNMAKDSLRWSDIGASLRIKFGKFYTLNLSGSFNPYLYQLNSKKQVVMVDKLRWDNGKLPRFRGTSTSFGFSLNNSTLKKLLGLGADGDDKSKNQNSDAGNNHQNSQPDGNNNNNPGGNHGNSSNDKLAKGADGYDKVTIPWNISINYNISYIESSKFDTLRMEYKRTLRHGLSGSWNIALTPNWKISSSTAFDFQAKKLTYSSINVTRNLHCWTMTGSFVPFGTYKSYTFRIGVNASMLQDLKYDKKSDYQGASTITWY